MKAYVLLIFTLLVIPGYSQQSINNYKYVIVPEKFDFLREDNQYGLNMTTKLLLQQKGLTAFLESETLPAELAANKCNALKADVAQKKGLFVTNLTLLLKDCQGNVVFKSKEGKSREKEFMAAYNLALRDAFTSLNDVEYKYDGTVFTQSQQSPVAVTPAPAPATTAPATTAPSPAPAQAVVTESAGTLYAQATPNGYQLIDTTPKKLLTLFKTSVEDHFIAEDGSSNGVVFRKNGEWFFEYYKENKLVSQKLQIKF